MEADNRYVAVIQSLREAVTAAGPGTRLPSVRHLIEKHRVSPKTVERAFAELASEGLIEPRPGQGTFVLARPTNTTTEADYSWQSAALGAGRADAAFMQGLLALPPSASLVLSTGYLPAELQATDLLAAALKQVAARRELWDRLPVEGFEPLRVWFSREIGKGVVFTPNDVVIYPGGQAAIASTLRALVPPGHPILIETPTYAGAIAAARGAGLELVPVPMDHQGARPELLADAFRRTGARAFYSQPTFSNPTGALMPAGRRQAILDVVSKARAFIIEDDWARDLDLTGTAPPPLAELDRNGHVIHIRSLSKSIAPGVRIAAVMARGAALARLKSVRGMEDFFVAGPLQAAALSVVSSSAWKRHLRSVRAELTERRDALVESLRTEIGDRAPFRVPGGGMHLWLRLPDYISDTALAAEAARRGVIVSAGRAWFPADPDGSFMRVTFAAPLGALRDGARCLAKAFSEVGAMRPQFDKERLP